MKVKIDFSKDSTKIDEFPSITIEWPFPCLPRIGESFDLDSFLDAHDLDEHANVDKNDFFGLCWDVYWIHWSNECVEIHLTDETSSNYNGEIFTPV